MVFWKMFVHYCYEWRKVDACTTISEIKIADELLLLKATLERCETGLVILQE